MARKEWYRVETLPAGHSNGYGGFTVQKYDGDTFQPTGYYSLTRDRPNGPYHCDCFAGLAGKYCRHKQLVPIFEQANKIGTASLYNFDKQKWYEPPPPDEEIP